MLSSAAATLTPPETLSARCPPTKAPSQPCNVSDRRILHLRKGSYRVRIFASRRLDESLHEALMRARNSVTTRAM
ncbi:hypothetical protein BDW71DRAFT_191366 [Aspergillus fruticulosus]